MAEKKCCCSCGAKPFWLVAAVLVVLIAVFARSCAKERQPSQQPAQPQPERPLTAEERIAERVADTNYVADLNGVADRYGKLGSLRAEAEKEFDEWRSSFLAANAEARELAARLAEAKAAAAENAEALAERLKGLYKTDAKGAALLDKIEKIGAAVEDNRRAAADYIGARLRKQTAPGSPPPSPAQ